MYIISVRELDQILPTVMMLTLFAVGADPFSLLPSSFFGWSNNYINIRKSNTGETQIFYV